MLIPAVVLPNCVISLRSSTQISDKLTVMCEKLITIPNCSLDYSPAPGCTVEGIMARYRCIRQAGRMAINLAVNFFFGPEVMSRSTITGVGTTLQLNVHKMEQIRLLVLQKFGRKMSELDKIEVWTRCTTAIVFVQIPTVWQTTQL